MNATEAAKTAAQQAWENYILPDDAVIEDCSGWEDDGLGELVRPAFLRWENAAEGEPTTRAHFVVTYDPATGALTDDAPELRDSSSGNVIGYNPSVDSPMVP